MVLHTLHDVDFELRGALDSFEEEKDDKEEPSSSPERGAMQSLRMLSIKHAQGIDLLTAAVKKVDDLTMSPKVANICGNLFFSELVEFVQVSRKHYTTNSNFPSSPLPPLPPLSPLPPFKR